MHLAYSIAHETCQRPLESRASAPVMRAAPPQQHTRGRCRCRAPTILACAADDASNSSSGSIDAGGSFPSLRSQFLPLGGGDAIALPPARPDIGPRFDLSREDALQVQLQALQANDQPYADHGIEVLYRFADFSPWARASYFGRSLDLGQFERFRRVFHTPYYRPLLAHESSSVLSSLEVDERCWKARLLVRAPHSDEEYTYEWTMVQRLGGLQDGFWRTHSLICDTTDWVHLRNAGI